MMLTRFLFFAVIAVQVFAKPRITDTPVEIDNDIRMHSHPLPTLRRSTRVADGENTADFWNSNARSTLEEKLSKGLNTNIAKNIIMFLGDGMSVPTLTAARIYKGQLKSSSGEEETLSFENFPFSGLSKTYCVDSQVADSACTATAYLGGVKNNIATIGVTADVAFGDCEASLNTNNQVYSIARSAQLAGKRTGLATTTTVTHASPAGVYAHVANRDWESDASVTASGADPLICRDIAFQAVYGETGENLNVILGGGRGMFLPRTLVDEEGQTGRRLDELNLVEGWLEQKNTRNQSAEFVWNRQELLAVSDDTDYLLGLFEKDHMQYNLDANKTTEPTLAEMTVAAIKILSQSDSGFFLFVEGGRIDHGHHSNAAMKALDETVEFAAAVEAAKNLTSEEDTLIVITSDHAHTMSISGYPERGNDIFGVADVGSDRLPYATLSYANGPGYNIEEGGIRHNVSEDNTHDKDYRFPATAPLSSETHGGDDVGIFASGPWAHLFSGVIEQNVIPHAMAYAACVGDSLTACEKNSALSSYQQFQPEAWILMVLISNLMYFIYGQQRPSL